MARSLIIPRYREAIVYAADRAGFSKNYAKFLVNISQVPSPTRGWGPVAPFLSPLACGRAFGPGCFGVVGRPPVGLEIGSETFALLKLPMGAPLWRQ